MTQTSVADNQTQTLRPGIQIQDLLSKSFEDVRANIMASPVTGLTRRGH